MSTDIEMETQGITTIQNKEILQFSKTLQSHMTNWRNVEL